MTSGAKRPTQEPQVLVFGFWRLTHGSGVALTNGTELDLNGAEVLYHGISGYKV